MSNLNTDGPISYKKHLFIVSGGRTGTGTLARIFNNIENGGACPEIYRSVHEPEPTLQALSKQIFKGNQGYAWAIDLLRATRPPQDIPGYYLESNGHLTYLLPELMLAFPGCKAAYVVRHPLSWISSGESHNESVSSQTLSRRLKTYEIDPTLPLDPIHPRGMDRHTEHLWRWLWLLRRVRLCMALSRPHIMIEKYESIFQSGMAGLMRIQDHFNVPLNLEKAREVARTKHGAAKVEKTPVMYEDLSETAKTFFDVSVLPELQRLRYPRNPTFEKRQ